MGFFFIHHHVRYISWSHPAFYSVGTGGSFCGGEVARE